MMDCYPCLLTHDYIRFEKKFKCVPKPRFNMCSLVGAVPACGNRPMLTGATAKLSFLSFSINVRIKNR